MDQELSFGSLLSFIQKSQNERREYKNNAYIHHQPFPKQGSEKQNVHADYNGDQEHNGDRYNI
jgi:hypothetical protein